MKGECIVKNILRYDGFQCYSLLRVLSEYKTLVLKMHQCSSVNNQITHNWTILKPIGNVGTFLLHANVWRTKWTNQIIPILVVLCVWFFSFYEIVPNRFLLLVQWPSYYLYEWCVPWVLELVEYNVKCSGAWINTYFKHKFGGVELPNFWHFHHDALSLSSNGVLCACDSRCIPINCWWYSKAMF